MTTQSEKFLAAENLLREHLKSMGHDERQALDVIGKIKVSGGTTDAALELMTPEDLQGHGVPPLLARAIARVFGWSATKEVEQQRIIVTSDDPTAVAARLKPEELVDEYDPAHPTNPFGMRLKEISDSQAFLVFDDNSVLLRKESKTLLAELLDGFSPRKNYMVAGLPRPVYKVGNRPARYTDEHPLYVGQKLRPDGYSDSGINWGAVPYEVRRLLRIAQGTAEIAAVAANINERWIFDCVTEDGREFEKAAQRYPNAAVEYKKLYDTNSLPGLRVQLGNPPQAAANPATK